MASRLESGSPVRGCAFGPAISRPVAPHWASPMSLTQYDDLVLSGLGDSGRVVGKPYLGITSRRQTLPWDYAL